MSIHQYFPLPGEYLATGVVGILIYTLIVYLSVQSIVLGIKSKSTKRFFIAIIIMSTLEFPRYVCLAVQENYSSKVAYSFHILAGIFFFIAFSIVCRQWSGLLQLGSYFNAIYGLNGLLVANITFAVVDILSVVMCAMSPTLFDYFSSTGYEIVTFIEGIRNCVYAVFLSYYGVKLVRRFWHFSILEQQVAAQKRGSAMFGFLLTANGTEGNVFTKVVLRLTSVLVLTTVCFTSRVCMLMAKMIAIHSNLLLTSPDFTMYGMLWFIFADFIPRAVPSLAFIFLMKTKKPARDQIKSADPGADDFQFVRLAGDEAESANSSHGLMESGRMHAGTTGADNEETTVTLNTMHNAGTGSSGRYEQLSAMKSPTQTTAGPGAPKPAFTINEEEEDAYEEDDDEDGENAIDRFFSILSLSATRPPAKTAPSGTVML